MIIHVLVWIAMIFLTLSALVGLLGIAIWILTKFIGLNPELEIDDDIEIIKLEEIEKEKQ